MERTDAPPTTRPPLVSCGACGRQLRATTAGPYSVGIPEKVYFYVRPHRGPDGAPCSCRNSEPMPRLSKRT